MIGSPSAETGIGPLISVWMPTSFSTGTRAAAGRAIASKRSKLAAKSSREKSFGTPSRQHGRVPCSQPPTAKALTSGLR